MYSYTQTQAHTYTHGLNNNSILDYQLQHFWMKKLRAVYPSSPNERTKFINKDSAAWKLFTPLPRYGELFIDTRIRSRISNQRLLCDIEIFINFSKQFPLKCRRN